MSTDATRHPLSVQAAHLLREAGYHVAPVALQEAGVFALVAEDPYAVVLLLAADEWEQIADVVDPVAVDFANWALEREPRAKQWDLYVCVLVGQPVANDDDLGEVERVADDTRYLRRLVRHGVAATEGAVTTALATLLPLRLPERIADRDPMKALSEALRGQGVSETLAAEAIQQFMVARGASG